MHADAVQKARSVTPVISIRGYLSVRNATPPCKLSSNNFLPSHTCANRPGLPETAQYTQYTTLESLSFAHKSAPAPAFLQACLCNTCIRVSCDSVCNNCFSGCHTHAPTTYYSIIQYTSMCTLTFDRCPSHNNTSAFFFLAPFLPKNHHPK